MTSTNRSLRTALLSATAALFLAANGAQAGFTTPSFRGTSGATYQEWDVFGDDNTSQAGIQDSSPEIANQNPNGTATVEETTGKGFRISSGNIYSPTAATAFDVTIPEADVPQPAHNVTAIVQIKTLGNELNYDSVHMNGLAPAEAATLKDTALGGFGGNDVETWYEFKVPYDEFGDGTPGTENLSLTFEAGDTSTSLDRLSIDTLISPVSFSGDQPNPNPGTSPIPEPASLAVLAAGGGLLLRRRRR